MYHNNIAKQATHDLMTFRDQKLDFFFFYFFITIYRYSSTYFANIFEIEQRCNLTPIFLVVYAYRLFIDIIAAIDRRLLTSFLPNKTDVLYTETISGSVDFHILNEHIAYIHSTYIRTIEYY